MILKEDILEDTIGVIKMCKCCGRKKPQGKCIINGIRRNLTDTCRYCFIRNPENSDPKGKSKGQGRDYYRHHDER
jgi:hypothetical protein